MKKTFLFILFVVVLASVASAAPSINQSTYNHSTAVNFSESIVWRTNTSTFSSTQDSAPVVRFDTNETAWCRISSGDENWSAMNASKDCGTTNSTSHVCTLGGSLSTFGPNALYLACVNPTNTSIETTSGALAVSFETFGTPTIDNTTLNHTTALNNTGAVVWRTDYASPSLTYNNQPSVSFDTDVYGYCRISSTNQTFDAMSSSKDCAITNATSHVCDLTTSLVYDYGSYAYHPLYIRCENPFDGLTSSALGLNVSLYADIPYAITNASISPSEPTTDDDLLGYCNLSGNQSSYDVEGWWYKDGVLYDKDKLDATFPTGAYSLSGSGSDSVYDVYWDEEQNYVFMGIANQKLRIYNGTTYGGISAPTDYAGVGYSAAATSKALYLLTTSGGTNIIRIYNRSGNTFDYWKSSSNPCGSNNFVPIKIRAYDDNYLWLRDVTGDDGGNDCLMSLDSDGDITGGIDLFGLGSNYAPIENDDDYVVFSYGSKAVVYNKTNGNWLRNITLSGGALSNGVHDGKLYTRGYVYDLSTGNEIANWTIPSSFSGIDADDHYIYAGYITGLTSYRAYWRVYDRDDYSLVFSTDFGIGNFVGGYSATFAATDSRIFMGTQDSFAAAIKKSDTLVNNGTATQVGFINSSETSPNEEWVFECRVDNEYVNYQLNSSPVSIASDAPNISSSYPATYNVSMYAGESQLFNVTVNESGNTTISYDWFVDGDAQGENDSTFIYNSACVNAGVHNITLRVNDSTNTAQQEWNLTVLTNNSLTFSYVTHTVMETIIRIDPTSFGDSYQMYLDSESYLNSSDTSILLADLNPGTSYSFLFYPVKNGVCGLPNAFSISTLASDEVAPTITAVSIDPSTAYTQSQLTGYCTATDVDSADIDYTYTWFVNDVSVKSGVGENKPSGVRQGFSGPLFGNYSYLDNVTFSCVVDDDVFTTPASNASVSIVNTPSEITEILVEEYNATDYLCNYTVTDDDGDANISSSYQWYLNGSLTTNTTAFFPAEYVGEGSTLVCTVETGDGIVANDTQNSTVFVFGDATPPTIELVTHENVVFTDTSALVEVLCVDENGIANGYPQISFTNPNGGSGSYSLVVDGTDTYYRYITYGIAGTYTDVLVTCRDGNGNTETLSITDVYATARETTVSTSGGGGGGVVFVNVTEYNIDPYIIEASLASGSRTQKEFEIINVGDTDIDFTVNVLMDERTPQTFDWMSFADGTQSFSFSIERPTGGFSSNNQFVRVVIDVPEGVADGEYYGIVEVIGLNVTQQVEVQINVGGTVVTDLVGYLSTPLFSLPLKRTVVDEVTGVEVEENVPFSVGALLLVLILAGAVLLIINKVKNKDVF